MQLFTEAKIEAESDLWELAPLHFALGIEAEILLLIAKDCSRKPDP